MKFNDPGRVVRHRGGVYLKSPHYGQVKLNCDASVNMDEKKVVVGGVFRNHNGAFIFALNQETYEEAWAVQERKTNDQSEQRAISRLGRIDGDPALRGTRIRATWEYVSSVGGGQQGMIVMAAQLIHDRVEMECLEGAWETLEGNTRCRFRGMIRFTATSLVHPDEPARTLQRTVEWILPTPTPYRLVEPVQVIEVTSSEEDPEEDLEELPPEPAVDALDFLEGDEDPLPEVDSPEDVMSASEADSTEDSGPGEMVISGGSSS
ncbi:hypothetical protein JHK82_024547 [Glycine max]|nr:hypothetical protein JHK85_025146 [Glycine max]KAG5012384.1 hypothetical protein JHK86_024645 [Glycine max]KAG5133359.1 hypothetical protein JHK82_024547 [Glycine max]